MSNSFENRFNQGVEDFEETQKEYERLQAEKERSEKELNERLWKLQAGIYGGGTALYGTYRYGRQSGSNLKRAAGVDDLPTASKGSKIGRVARGAGKVFGLAGNIFGFGSNMGSLAGVGLKKGFDKQINGRYFNFGKAVRPYMWIIGVIDIILMFLPGVKIVDAILGLGVNLPATIYEAAAGIDDNKVTRYTDWSEALQRAFGQAEYEKWQEDMKTHGRSALSLSLSETKRDYEVDKSKLGAEKLLEKDVRDDYQNGKISKQLYDVMLKFAKGHGRMEEVEKLDPEEKKKLYDEYLMEKDYSWILRDIKQTLEGDVRDARGEQRGYVEDQLYDQYWDDVRSNEGFDEYNPIHWTTAWAVSLFRNTSDDQVEAYLLNDIKNADRIFDAGEVSIGYEVVNLTAREKFILYHFLMGDVSYLENASQSTKDKFEEVGLSVVDGEAKAYQPGPAAALYAKDNMKKELQDFEGAHQQLKQYMATAGHGKQLGRVKEIEKNVQGYGYGNKDKAVKEFYEKTKNALGTVINEDEIKKVGKDNRDEIEKITGKEVEKKSEFADPEPIPLNFGYRVVYSGWKWQFGTFHDHDSQDKIDYNHPGYHGVKIKSVVNPETGQRYYLKRELEAHEFFANPTAFQDAMPNGVYVNKNGTIFFGNPNATPETDTGKEVIEQHDERLDIQKQMIDFFKRNKLQEDSKAVYTPKTGANVAGGTNINTQYVKAGKASIAGGNRMKK